MISTLLAPGFSYVVALGVGCPCNHLAEAGSTLSPCGQKLTSTLNFLRRNEQISQQSTSCVAAQQSAGSCKNDRSGIVQKRRSASYSPGKAPRCEKGSRYCTRSCFPPDCRLGVKCTQIPKRSCRSSPSCNRSLLPARIMLSVAV